MFYFIEKITLNTLWYSLLWAAMMIIGGLMYEQPHFKRKDGTKYKTLELAGWCVIIMAMLGLIHAILAFFNLILV